MLTTLPKQTVYGHPVVRVCTVSYEGRFGQFYAFRLTPNGGGTGWQTMRNKLLDWVLDQRMKGSHLGNGFPNLPEVNLRAKGRSDLFLLVTTLTDVLTIQRKFADRMTGFVPTMAI